MFIKKIAAFKKQEIGSENALSNFSYDNTKLINEKSVSNYTNINVKNPLLMYTSRKYLDLDKHITMIFVTIVVFSK